MIRSLLPFVLLLAASCGGVETRAEDPEDIQRADQLFLSARYSKAAFLYQKYLDDFPETDQKARLLFFIAKCRMGEENWEKALAVLDEAMTARPDNVMRIEIHYRRAVVQNALWRPGAALRDLLVVESAHSSLRGRAVPEDQFRYRLGITRIRTGDWEQGKADLARVDRNGPLGVDAQIRMSFDRFAVQIARYLDPSSARRRVEAARRLGFDTRVHRYKDDYLVLVGSWPRFDGARAEAVRLRDHYRGAFVIP